MRTLLIALALLAFGTTTGAAAGDLAIKGDGYRLRLPDGFQAAPHSRGSEIETRVHALLQASGLPITGTPTARVFLHFGSHEPGVLVLLRYRMPGGSGINTGEDLKPEQLSRAWEIAVGASGRQAVRDVRRVRLNALHAGVEAVLLESTRAGSTTQVRIAMTAASDQLITLAYAAPEGEDEAAHAAAWKATLGSLRVVAPGVDWLLYLKYGGIIAGGLVLLLLGWWAAMRPTLGPRNPPPEAVTGIRALDGMGLFIAGSEPARTTLGSSGHAPLTNPLELDPFARPEPALDADLEALPVPMTGEDWDPEQDPAFAAPPSAAEDDAPLRPQLAYGAGDPTPLAPPPRAIEVDDTAPGDSVSKDTQSGVRINRNLDFLS